MESLHAVNSMLESVGGDEIGQWRELDKLNKQRRCRREREISQILSACNARLGTKKSDSKAVMYSPLLPVTALYEQVLSSVYPSFRYDNCLPGLSDKRNH